MTAAPSWDPDNMVCRHCGAADRDARAPWDPNAGFDFDAYDPDKDDDIIQCRSCGWRCYATSGERTNRPRVELVLGHRLDERAL